MPPNKSFLRDKRKLDTRNSSVSKRAKTDNPFDYSSEAFRRWRARRLVEPAADVFAATTIRADAHKLKRLPPEIRRMIYVQLFRQRYGNIEVFVDADKPLQQPVFHAGSRALEGQHYLNSKYVGDQIAAEAAEALYENSRFEVDLSHLATFLQPRPSLPGVKPAALIRSLLVRMDGERPYTGWGKDNKMINASDWIDLSKDMPVRQDELDDHPNPFRPFKLPTSTDSTANAWKWRRTRDRNRAEHAGLNLLCRMPKLKMLEVEVRCEVSCGPEIRPLIPTIRRLGENGVVATVSSEGFNSTDFDGYVVPICSDDLTELFSLPSPEDLEFAARHALTEHINDYRMQNMDTLYNTLSFSNCADYRCVRVELNELYEELKERVAPHQALQGAHIVAEPDIVASEYGSSPSIEAQEWLIAVDEAHVAKSQPMEATDEDGLHGSANQSDPPDR